MHTTHSTEDTVTLRDYKTLKTETIFGQFLGETLNEVL